jgi:hypothetical protein
MNNSRPNNPPSRSRKATPRDLPLTAPSQKKPRQRKGRNTNNTNQGPISRTAPVATSKNIKTQRPNMRTMKNGDCHIIHREYVSDINASSGPPSVFSVTPFAVNPGQSSTFQWLSKVAANFESYKFNKLKFDYETEAPTSLGGTLMLTLDYDATDPAPVSKQQAMAYRGSVRSAPWTPCCHSSIHEDLSKNKTYFVRPGSQPANTDIKLYDVGNLFVMSKGVTTADAALGELYVDYDVMLMTPIYEPTPTIQYGGYAVSNGGSPSNANPLGTTPNLSSNHFGFSFDDASNLTINVAGNYLLSFDAVGTVLGTQILTPDGFSVANQINFVVNAAGTEMLGVYEITASAPTVIAFSTTGTTISSSTVYLALMPNP